MNQELNDLETRLDTFYSNCVEQAELFSYRLSDYVGGYGSMERGVVGTALISLGVGAYAGSSEGITAALLLGVGALLLGPIFYSFGAIACETVKPGCYHMGAFPVDIFEKTVKGIIKFPGYIGKTVSTIVRYMSSNSES